MIEENINKYEIRLDPIDFHPGLREQIDAFQNRIKEEGPGAKLARKLEEKLAKRFCHVCFFGKVEGEVMGEPMCEECARELYGITKDGKWNSERLGDLSRQIWYRKLKALPVFEAYLQAELERWKLESHFGWRSWKLDPPKANGNDDFIFCGHQKYDHQPDEETEYFVDVGYLDMDGTLCMFNDWHEGQETFEIDYWFPLPRHPDEPKKETKEDE